MLIKIIYIFSTLVVLKALYNLYYFLLSRKFLSKYENYIKNSEEWYIIENKQKIVTIIKKAGIEDSYRPYVEPVGYWRIVEGNISVFKNLDSRREDIMQLVYSILREINSIFKSRIIDSFNPVYWIETVIYLPRTILFYFGVKADNTIVKIFQIIWWILVFVSTIVSIFFNQEFIDWIENIKKYK